MEAHRTVKTESQAAKLKAITKKYDNAIGYAVTLDL